MYIHIPTGALCSLLIMSNKYKFYAWNGWCCILQNLNKFRTWRNTIKYQQLFLSMAWWIYLSLYKCDTNAGILFGTCSPVFRRNTLFWFAFDVTCILGLWNRLCQYKQVGFEYGYEKCQLLYEQRRMQWSLCHLKRK